MNTFSSPEIRQMVGVQQLGNGLPRAGIEEINPMNSFNALFQFHSVTNNTL